METWIEKIANNFPKIFYQLCKMHGDFLCAEIAGKFYWINTVTQESGQCDQKYKNYVFSGYDFSHDNHPIERGTHKRIVKKDVFAFETMSEAENYLSGIPRIDL